jgi:hypothetical protein
LRLTIDPAVLHMSLANGDAVLVHLRTANYYSLNETGDRIWCLLANGTSPEEAARRLQRDYDVGGALAVASVGRLVRELADEGLVQLAVENELA